MPGVRPFPPFPTRLRQLFLWQACRPISYERFEAAGRRRGSRASASGGFPPLFSHLESALKRINDAPFLLSTPPLHPQQAIKVPLTARAAAKTTWAPQARASVRIVLHSSHDSLGHCLFTPLSFLTPPSHLLPFCFALPLLARLSSSSSLPSLAPSPSLRPAHTQPPSPPPAIAMAACQPRPPRRHRCRLRPSWRGAGSWRGRCAAWITSRPRPRLGR